MVRRKRNPIITILIAAVFLNALSLGSLNAFAMEVVGAETGLRVHVSDVLVPTDNLAPGDTKTSTMTITLDPSSGVQTSSLPVWLKAEITGKTPGLGGGDLDDKLELNIINYNGRQLYKGSVSGFNKSVKVGDIRKGESFDLTFTVHLPTTTGNEYQAASMKVKWVIITQYTPPDEPDPTPTDAPTVTPTLTPTPTPVITTTPTPTTTSAPSATPTPSTTPAPSSTPTPTTTPGPTMTPVEPPDDEEQSGEVVIIEEEPIAAGLPKTGELPPILFYGLGAGIIYLGFRLNQKKHKK